MCQLWPRPQEAFTFLLLSWSPAHSPCEQAQACLLENRSPQRAGMSHPTETVLDRQSTAGEQLATNM